MSQARIHRQGLRIAQLKDDIKDLKKRLSNCKEVEGEIQEYLRELEVGSNNHFQRTLDKVERQYLRKSKALDRVEYLQLVQVL